MKPGTGKHRASEAASFMDFFLVPRSHSSREDQCSSSWARMMYQGLKGAKSLGRKAGIS